MKWNGCRVGEDRVWLVDRVLVFVVELSGGWAQGTCWFEVVKLNELRLTAVCLYDRGELVELNATWRGTGFATGVAWAWGTRNLGSLGYYFLSRL